MLRCSVHGHADCLCWSWLQWESMSGACRRHARLLPRLATSGMSTLLCCRQRQIVASWLNHVNHAATAAKGEIMRRMVRHQEGSRVSGCIQVVHGIYSSTPSRQQFAAQNQDKQDHSDDSDQQRVKAKPTLAAQPRIHRRQALFRRRASCHRLGDSHSTWRLGLATAAAAATPLLWFATSGAAAAFGCCS